MFTKQVAASLSQDPPRVTSSRAGPGGSSAAGGPMYSKGQVCVCVCVYVCVCVGGGDTARALLLGHGEHVLCIAYMHAYLCTGTQLALYAHGQLGA